MFILFIIVAVIKTKYKSLRTYYGRLRRAHMELVDKETRSWAGASSVPPPTWEYYESMSFLNEVLATKNTESTIPEHVLAQVW